MSAAAVDRLIAAIDGTWPAASMRRFGPWTLREGRGGGQRVSAATAEGPIAAEDIDAAARAMREMGQRPIFMVRPGEKALDAALDAAGYLIHDPVAIHARPAAELTDLPIPRVTMFTVWEPLALMEEIWAAGGIGLERIAVMQRARGPRTGLLCRWNEKPAGAGFVAIHDGVAMLHALEILPHQRGQGVAQWIVRAAAHWAVQNGADTLAALCLRANVAGQALFASLKMRAVEEYHYRVRPAEEEES